MWAGSNPFTSDASLLAAIPGIVLAIDMRGFPLFANEQALEFAGQSTDELRKRPWHALVHRDDLARARELSADSDRNSAIIRLCSAEGANRWHSVSLRPLQRSDDSAASCLLVAIDVDDLKRNEEAMQHERERFQFAERASSIGIWEWDIRTGDLYWSEGMERVYGVEPGTFEGGFEDYIKRIHPDDREQVRESTREFAETGELRNEHRIIHPDGTTHWLAGRGQLVHDSDGQPVRAIGVGVDITHRHQIEEQLRNALAAKDAFFGLLSHEIKNPLTSIIGMTSILRRWGDRLDEQTRAETLDQLVEDSERLLESIENMLVLARLDEERIELEPVLVHRLLSRFVRSARRSYPEREISLDIEERLPPVLAQGVLVDQILRNLVSNALKYSPTGEPVEIVVRGESGGVAIRVLDRGPGIEHADRVFDRFFRDEATADIAPGVGIGLTVCRRLVRAQRGDIWCRPRQGGGTEFGFWLPAAVADE